ncbi:MAG TPA: alanine racemase [Nitrososphaeraceae archaeon]|jgi:division protein CdvB (Snf7/Vps24/ESCRT-III family)
MTSFSNQWNKEVKKDTSERIRESLRSQKPLKPTMETAKNRLGIQTQKLDALLEKLKSKDRTLFNQIVSHLQNHDSQQSKMLSNELSQVRRTIKTISQLKMSLEQVHMRLESTIDIGDALTALKPAVGTLSKVKTGLTGLMPNVDSELGEINDVFSDIMVNANSTSDIGFALNPSGGDINNILAEASIVAEQRVTDNFPDVPMGNFNRNSRSSIGENTE